MSTVLVIDDEEGIRNLLDAILNRKGYQEILAESGRKGLELFHRDKPDVIVLDMKMPEMDGLAVLQEIRRADSHQPVIVLTGGSTAEAEQHARALGVTKFVEKEFSLHLLGDALKGILRHTAAQSQR